MIEILGWSCTLMVLIGYWLNATGRHTLAMFTWIVGDFGWIVYDYLINNWSHFALSTIIIVINVYGVRRIKKKIMSRRKINKISEGLFS